MEPYLLAVIVLMVGVYFWQDRQFQKERLSFHAEIGLGRSELSLAHVAHNVHLTKQFDAYREDVAQLCQRIQAPELAVVEHQQGRVMEPDSHPLTDEQIAQQQEQAALISRMEEIENAGILS